MVFLLPVAIGVAAVLLTRSFEPSARARPLRWLVTLTTAGAGVALLVSLWSDWWIVYDYERDQTLLTEGTSGFPVVIVALSLIACVSTVSSAWGARNWAPLVLGPLWLTLLFAWWASTGEGVDVDAGGEELGGLAQATWASLAVTGAAVVGSFNRLVERGRGGSRQRRAFTPRDAKIAIGVAVIAVLAVVQLLPEGLRRTLAFGAALAALARYLVVTGRRDVEPQTQTQPQPQPEAEIEVEPGSEPEPR